MPLLKPTDRGGPEQSGTGKGFLTPEQEKFIARYWYAYIQGKQSDEYQRDMQHFRSLPEDEQRALMEQEQAQGIPGLQKYVDGLRDEQKVGGSGTLAPGGRYSFPEPSPNYIDPRDGSLSGDEPPDGYYSGTIPPGSVGTPPGETSPSMPGLGYFAPADYGHRSTLTPEQNHAYQMMMQIAKHSGGY